MGLRRLFLLGVVRVLMGVCLVLGCTMWFLFVVAGSIEAKAAKSGGAG